MNERSLRPLILLFVSLILPAVFVLANFWPSPPLRLGSTVVADGVPLPPPEPLPPSRLPRNVRDTLTHAACT
jgi:hypothetical protein